ncbi:MAG: hypothetical protein AAB733_03150, partial [Patescibacteria group bacterium]
MIWNISFSGWRATWRQCGGSVVILFCGALALALWFQWPRTFVDPDSFYHAKMAWIMGTRQWVVSSFPWLSDFTVLGDYYIDQHFLYHVLLIPFVLGLGMMTGTKVFTALAAASVVTVFYMILRRLGARGAFIFSLFLLFTEPFWFRMNLAKAPSLSLIVLFVGLLLSVRNQWRWLFPLSFFYVWMYGGFPLLFVVTGVVAGVSMAKALLQPADFKQRWRALWRHPQWKSVGAVASGMLAGVVVNPFFPNNLAFYWQQTVQIGLINYQTKIGVVREWYPYAITDLIPQTIFVSIFVLVAMVFFVLRRRQQPTHHIATGVLALGFFLLVLKSRRYIEYYVPFAILWSALVISETIVATGWKRIWNLGRNFFEEQAFLAVLSVMVLLIFPPIIIVRDFFASHNIFVRAHAESRYAGASKWLREHATPDAIIFHSDWDDFPAL